MGGGWVLELDIESFFDTMSRRRLREFLDTRIRDSRSESLVRGAGCVNRARPDLWEPWEGNFPGPPDQNSVDRLLGPHPRPRSSKFPRSVACIIATSGEKQPLHSGTTLRQSRSIRI